MARLLGIIAKSPVDFTVTIGNPQHVTLATHGWGAAWYENKKLTIRKGIRSAVNPLQNDLVTFTIRSHQFLFHMRQASSGSISEKNCHPFSYHNTAFAHIGQVHLDSLLGNLLPPYNESFESEPIDSEVYFRNIMQEKEASTIEQAVDTVAKTANTSRGANFIMIDGESAYGYRYGLPLFWSRWQFNQPFSVTTPAGVHIQSDALSSVVAYVISSEKLHGGNWNTFDEGELLTIDKSLQYKSFKVTSE